MAQYLVELEFDHTQSEIDMVDVEAIDRAEAVAYASLDFKRRAWGTLRDPQIVSATAIERPARRFRLDLGSQADDLDVREAAQ